MGYLRILVFYSILLNAISSIELLFHAQDDTISVHVLQNFDDKSYFDIDDGSFS